MTAGYVSLSAVLREARRTWLVPYVATGLVWTVGGGLTAAATAYVTTQQTAWATAYIVLVGGVALAGLGAAVYWLAPLAPRRHATEILIGWNTGNALVLAGQLGGVVTLTDIGTALLVASLALLLLAVRVGRRRGDPVMAAARARFDSGESEVDPPRPHPAAWWLLRGLVVLLGVSMVVGVILAHWD